MTDLDKAAGLFRSFREERPKRARRVTLSVPKAAAVMGRLEFVGYMTTHRGKTHLYIHEFAQGSRPILAAGKGRGELFIIGKRFKVTGRGITDIDASGRTVHARRRFEVKRKGRQR